MFRASSRARGAAISEFLLVAAPLLLAGLGVVETARWYLVRQTVGHALLEAARAGATQHAAPAALREGLRLGLLPLYASAATSAGLADGLQRLDQRQRDLEARFGLAPWHIEILSPTPAHFADFMLTDAGDGYAGIPNSYQQERHAAYVAQGRPAGRGPASGATLFDANVLTVQLTYLHTPLVPGIGWLLRSLGRAAGPGGYAGAAMSRAGLLPIRQRISVAMQSHPRPFQAGGIASPLRPVPPGQAGSPALNDACVGVWCTPVAAEPAPIPPWPDTAPTPPASPDVPGLPVPGEGDGCGVVLCCAIS